MRYIYLKKEKKESEGECVKEMVLNQSLPLGFEKVRQHLFRVTAICVFLRSGYVQRVTGQSGDVL